LITYSSAVDNGFHLQFLVRAPALAEIAVAGLQLEADLST
jgi:hypothetical protein